MTEIISALITAVASVIVAIINKSGGREQAAKESGGKLLVKKKNTNWWFGLGPAIIIWLIISPIIIHHDFSAVNLFGLIPATLLMAALIPINPLNAAVWILGLHTVNFAGEPIQRLVTGGTLQDAFTGFQFSDIILLTAVSFGNALLAGWISHWQISKSGEEVVREESVESIAGDEGTSAKESEGQSGEMAAELERLHSLYQEGALTEQEYQHAKEKILGNSE
jgi:hypothetical protein